MTSPQSEKVSAVHILAIVNHLSLQAYLVKSFESLAFQIVNDTQHAIFYNRALLWQWQEQQRHLLKISGQTDVNTKSVFVERASKLISHLLHPEKMQMLQSDSFPSSVQQEWQSIMQDQTTPQIIWIPIFSQQKLLGGLWLERWHDQEWDDHEVELLGFISAVYGAVWQRFQPRFFWRNLWRYWSFFTLGSLLLLFLIQVPLRVVAPCEVVAADPITITSPLEGIISHLNVKPGDSVKEGDVLFEYDKKVPMQQLIASQKQVEIRESELHRALSLAFSDPALLSEVEILSLNLHKEKIALETAQHQAEKLVVHAPISGITLLEDPERWRGTPVTVGEKLLQICDPHKTKVRLWIPENDNVILNDKKPLKIFLNVHPEKSLSADLRYIASYSHITDKGIPSFLAEGDWAEGSAVEPKLGLKGSAILYGEDVTLFYWIVRRPWTAARNFLGF